MNLDEKVERLETLYKNVREIAATASTRPASPLDDPVQAFAKVIVDYIDQMVKGMDSSASFFPTVIMEDMTWVLGYINKLDEKLIDAVKENDITYKSAIRMASGYDHLFDANVEQTVKEAFQ